MKNFLAIVLFLFAANTAWAHAAGPVICVGVTECDLLADSMQATFTNVLTYTESFEDGCNEGADECMCDSGTECRDIYFEVRYTLAHIDDFDIDFLVCAWSQGSEGPFCGDYSTLVEPALEEDWAVDTATTLRAERRFTNCLVPILPVAPFTAADCTLLTLLFPTG